MKTKIFALENYFFYIPPIFQSLFQKAQSADCILKFLPLFIEDFFAEKTASPPPPCFRKLKNGDWTSEDSYQTESPWVNKEQKIFIGEKTKIEPGALIKNRVIVLGKGEIRQGAYLREESVLGEHCVIGHTTETKACLFLEHGEAGHFNYVGNSVLGAYVNLGAGTKLANLEFRTTKEKKEEIFPEISFSIQGEKIPSGFHKFGSVVGEGCEIGCNAVLAPGCFLGSESRVTPNLFLKKGYYPPKSFLALL